MRNRWQVMLLVCVTLCISMLGGCNSRSGKTSEETPTPGVNYEKGVDFTGVIKEIDTENQLITFYNASFEEEEIYSYSGGTMIFSKNKRDMSMAEVSLGEVYDIYTNEDGTKIKEMHGNGTIVEQFDVPVSINAAEKRLTVQGVTYAYTDHMVVLSDGESIDPMEITSNDLVTFRGVKGQAYSLIVTRGHGYIRPKNYGDLVGGTLTIQGEAILPISEGMLLTVPEGTQVIRMINGDLTAEATVKVERNKVTSVNIRQYQSLVPDMGRVTFKIIPDGAELYINGRQVDYSKPVSLRYGVHQVKVVLEGYNSYSGAINVRDPAPTVQINLAEETATVEEEDDSGDDDEKSTSVSKDDDDKESSEKAEEPETDDEHKITVSAPSGASVYINGTYKGVAPCSFTKVIGSVTLTLSKEGCETKSYTIEVIDDSKDITWSFPDLTKESQG